MAVYFRTRLWAELAHEEDEALENLAWLVVLRGRPTARSRTALCMRPLDATMRNSMCRKATLHDTVRTSLRTRTWTFETILPYQIQQGVRSTDMETFNNRVMGTCRCGP